MLRLIYFLFGLTLIGQTFAQAIEEVPLTEADTILAVPVVHTSSEEADTILAVPVVHTSSEEADSMQAVPAVQTPSAEADSMQAVPAVQTPSAEADTFQPVPIVLTPSEEADTIQPVPILPTPLAEADTIQTVPIIFTPSTASDYIRSLINSDQLWRPSGEILKQSLVRLADHYIEPYDSVESRLLKYNYDSIFFQLTGIVRNDTLPLRWLNDSIFIIDTFALKKNPVFETKTIIEKITEYRTRDVDDIDPDMESQVDYILQEKDTIREMKIDSVYLKSMNVQMFKIVDSIVRPPLLKPKSQKAARFLPDSLSIVISDTTKVLIADTISPFYIVSGEEMPDSLRLAVATLLDYASNRDSSLIFVNNVQGYRTPFWLSRNNNELYRYWIKNSKNDSITIWVGNPDKNNITLILEEDIHVNRMQKIVADDIPFIVARPDKTLAKILPLEPIPVLWNYNFSSSLSLNQTYLSNWAKGGENSFSSVLDVLGSAKYTNSEYKTQWTNSVRVKHGNIITEEYGRRTNTDLFELNSQYNKVLKDKIDFSTVFYMKNQLAKGYKYPNDSVVISKFLNPGTFTVGAGFEYKPSKETSFNFSLLSYKNTFVLDTANINQKAHGIANDKRAKQEMGGQLMINSKMNILDGLIMSNSIRLFSGYLDKPENIDVDWEITMDKMINWYFTIRLNLHFIYDDDIRFTVLDENEKPIKLPDGSIYKVPKLQFKEFLGLTLLFKF